MLLETHVLQDDDPDLPGLLRAGFVVVGESWGARLRLAPGHDAAGERRLQTAVRGARSAGVRIVELDPSASGVSAAGSSAGADAADIVALERQTTPDYPYTPATAHHAPQLDEVHDWPRRGLRAFGARTPDGVLVAVSVGRETFEHGDRLGDHDFVSVARDHRGQGIAKGIVAAWILALAADGVRTFATGGAAQNSGSLGMVRALGFAVEERWLSLQRP